MAKRPEELFKTPRDAPQIADEEYERPKSKIEAEELGIPGETLREKDVLEPAKRQFRRTLANFTDAASGEQHQFSLSDWATAMMQANQVKNARIMKLTKPI